MRLLLRSVVIFATFTVVWLIASPAQASAPVCDPRGAIMFAPPPQIQDEERSIDVVNDCMPESPLDVKNAVPGRGPQSLDWSSSQEPAATIALAVPAVFATDRLDVPVSASARLPRGITTSVERPPRR